MLEIRQYAFSYDIAPKDWCSFHHSAGSANIAPDCFELCFNTNKDVYQLVFEIPYQQLCNALSFKFKLSGWRQIKYFAVGYQRDEHFVHLKAPNIAQGQEFELGFSHHDLIFRIQNSWQLLPPVQLVKIKVYIKGTPEAEQGMLSVYNGKVWLEEQECKPFQHNASQRFNPKLITTIQGYWKKCYPEFASQGADFFYKGHFPVGSYPVMTNTMSWDISKKKPIDISHPTTYRYSWHALNAVSVFLLAAEQKSLVSLLSCAKELVNRWLDDSYFSPDPDQKYCWYDHGTAERTLVLLVMWQLGLKHRFDFRFMSRIQDSALRHAQLLASEAFYAGHQPYRYHNHAWFQDIALIAAGICYADLPGTEQWIVRGEQRLADQLQHLIVRDNGFAVFTENSVGYHQGIQRLVNFAATLLKLANYKSDIPCIALELEHWTRTYCYPDGRFPAQGDTFRKANSSVEGARSLKDWQSCSTLLANAGYALVKSGTKQQPWMLTLVATNLNKTHKHQDDLSITLWFDNVEWLTDPSFYSHEYDKALPAFLRSASAHNMMWVPSAVYNIDPVEGRTQLYIKKCREAETIVGSSNACQGFLIQREISYRIGDEGPDIVGKDQFYPSGFANVNEEAVVTFHFGDGVSLTRSSEDNLWYLTHPGSSFRLKLRILSIIKHGDVSIQTAACGLAFMEQAKTTLLTVKVRSKQVFQWQVEVEQHGHVN